MQRLRGKALLIGSAWLSLYKLPSILQSIRCRAWGTLSLASCVQVPVADNDFEQAQKMGARLYKFYGTDRQTLPHLSSWLMLLWFLGLHVHLLFAQSCCCQFHPQHHCTLSTANGVLVHMQGRQEAGLWAGVSAHVHAEPAVQPRSPQRKHNAAAAAGVRRCGPSGSSVRAQSSVWGCNMWVLWVSGSVGCWFGDMACVPGKPHAKPETL